MFLTIVSKNGERITDKNENTIFESKEQHDRFWEWAWQVIPYGEAKKRVEKLGYEVREDNDAPETVSRFGIWRRVCHKKRKPEPIEFEGMMLKIRIS